MWATTFVGETVRPGLTEMHIVRLVDLLSRCPRRAAAFLPFRAPRARSPRGSDLRSSNALQSILLCTPVPAMDEERIHLVHDDTKQDRFGVRQRRAAPTEDDVRVGGDEAAARRRDNLSKLTTCMKNACLTSVATYFRCVDIPWRRVAATPRPTRGYAVETSRGDALES